MLTGSAMDLYSIVQYGLFLAIVTVMVKPLGGYMERVFSGKKTVLDWFCVPIERLIYRVTAIDPTVEMTAPQYAISFVLLAWPERFCYIASSDCRTFCHGFSLNI